MKVLVLLLAFVAFTYAQNSLCNGKQEGFYPDLYDCQWYFWCNNDGTVERHMCPNGQWYDRGRTACDHKDSVTCTPLELPETQPDCPANGTSTIEKLGYCNQYYLCVGGERFERSCGFGTEFDTVNKTCRDDKIAVCNKCPLVDVEGQLVILPDKTDCAKYIICRNREEISMTCDGDLHFNEANTYCESPALAKCRVS